MPPSPASAFSQSSSSCLSHTVGFCIIFSSDKKFPWWGVISAIHQIFWPSLPLETLGVVLPEFLMVGKSHGTDSGQPRCHCGLEHLIPNEIPSRSPPSLLFPFAMVLWTACYVLPTFICWNPSPQCDDIWRWELREFSWWNWCSCKKR